MRPPPAAAISAIILAGGRGLRLGGRDKARLRYRRHALLPALIAGLQGQVGEIIVVRSHSRARLFRQPGVRWTADHQPHDGPVGGLLAGLQRARRAWCLCLPVDSVLPPPELIGRLARNSQRGGYARHGGHSYYLHQLLPRSSRRPLRQFHAAGGRAASNACRKLGLAAVDCPAQHKVWSLNTREELRQARWRRR